MISLFFCLALLEFNTNSLNSALEQNILPSTETIKSFLSEHRRPLIECLKKQVQTYQLVKTASPQQPSPHSMVFGGQLGNNKQKWKHLVLLSHLPSVSLGFFSWMPPLS
uniref:Uncharacterized protein n=1 Tax=Pavo cristatus TaxID=9049 RepID=A0A8C9F6E6_PAVCR